MLARVGRFPKIPFLHFTLSCASSLCNPRSLMSFLTHSFHVFLPLPFGLLPSTTTFLHADTQSPCSFLSTCPNHLSLARLTNSEILSMFNRPLIEALYPSTTHYTSTLSSFSLFSLACSYLQPSLAKFHYHKSLRFARISCKFSLSVLKTLLSS